MSGLFFFGLFFPVVAQDDDLFHVVDIRGKINIYRDLTGETSRVHVYQTIDEGDRVSTGAESELFLKLRGNYVHLGPYTTLRVLRLHQGDNGLEVRLNLAKGRMLCQMKKKGAPVMEVTADSVTFRAYGPLFEIHRNKESVDATAFSGRVVAEFHGKTRLVANHQVNHFENGRFRYLYYLGVEEKQRLQEWQNNLEQLKKEKWVKSP